jgi:hypothetical protein
MRTTLLLLAAGLILVVVGLAELRPHEKVQMPIWVTPTSLPH